MWWLNSLTRGKSWEHRELQLLGILEALGLQCMLAPPSQKTFSNQVSALAHTCRELSFCHLFWQWQTLLNYAKKYFSIFKMRKIAL